MNGSSTLRWYACAMAMGLAVTAPFGCAPFADLGGRQDSAPPSARCGECHVEIFEEWRASPHAGAFLSTEFLSHTDGGSISGCLPCHAPADIPAELGRPSVARTWALDEGVHCLACHRLAAGHGYPRGDDASRMAGPLGADALVQPHSIDARPNWFQSAELCGRCHEDTYGEWIASSEESRATCQSCHMPVVHRKVTQSTGGISGVLVAFEEAREMRAHTFDVPSALVETRETIGSDSIEVECKAPSSSSALALLSLRNRLPHAIPTGEFGGHSITIFVSTPNGEEITRWTLSHKRGTAIPAGATRQSSFRWPDSVEAVVVTLTLDGRRVGSETVGLRIRRAEFKLRPDVATRD